MKIATVVLALASLLLLAAPQGLVAKTHINPEELLSLTNQERIKNGVTPLKTNAKLDYSASQKVDDMFGRQYWAHTSPDGSKPWIFFERAGYNYKTAAENLAKGYNTNLATINGWLNSPEHRKALLNKTYREVGFGVLEGTLDGKSVTLVVAHFGQPRSEIAVNSDTNELSGSQASKANIPVYLIPLISIGLGFLRATSQIRFAKTINPSRS